MHVKHKSGLALKVILPLWAIAFLLSGCGTAVHKQHPALQFSSDTTPANVYFIRPMPVKFKGVADNKISVSYQDKTLLEIREGSYTLLKIKPGSGEITTHSKTMFTNRKEPIEVSRSRRYSFIGGRTYFIHLKRVNEEFRGIYYDPEPVDLATAKILAEPLRKVDLAKQMPIAAIKDVPPVPKSSPLEPLYPEEVYPATPYLLKKPQKE